MPGRAPTALSSNPGSQGRADGTEYETPPRPQVSAFHQESDQDSDTLAQHHTLGPAATQATPGDHSHDGGSSAPLWQGGVITGTRGSTGYYQSIEALLVAKGASNQAV